MANILILLPILLTLVIVLLVAHYFYWNARARRRLDSGGTVVETDLGRIEYRQYGRGPAILMFHGSPGGYDQGEVVYDMVKEGYSVIAPSRPGYLKTPLTDRTFEGHADLLATLLDKLGINKVAVAGYSGGGPTAIHFAARHPDKTACLILESAVSTTFIPTDSAVDSFWGRLFLQESFQDVLGWGTSVLMTLMPITMIKTILPIETTYDEEELKDYLDYIKSNRQHIDFYKKLVLSTLPLSLRRSGLDNDLIQFKAVQNYAGIPLKTPTLILHSPNDNDAPYEQAEYSKSILPEAELVNCHGGHLIWMGKDSGRLLARRRDFLRRHHH